MPSTTATLADKGLIKPPKWLPDNVLYETIMGSMAYGCNEDDSDMDVYGFCVPPKNLLFPHLAGEIPGFGTQLKRFDQFSTERTVLDPDARAGKGLEYDVTIYSIVRYFQLCMENNPNLIDSLFTARECVLFSSRVGERVRERRQLFLHRGCWHKFKGYAYQQLHRMHNKEKEGARAAIIAKYGYDVKYASHVVRLINEVEQILTEGDLDLRRSSAQQRDIRRGNGTEQQVRDWFSQREMSLQTIYENSKLPYAPDENAIKALLLECLEEHYGSLADCVVSEAQAVQALRDIRKILERVNM
jgi:uncharacterized protein